MYVAMYTRAMANMVRKQVYIERHQDRSLRARARLEGVTESQLIRQGVDRVLEGDAQLPPDDALWAAERQFIEARRKRLQVAPRRRRWTRDELYDE